MGITYLCSRDYSVVEAGAVLDFTAEIGEFFPHPEQLLIECGVDGRVLWMSDKARERLGNVTNVLDHIDGEQLAEARHFLSDVEPRGILRVRFVREAGNPAPVVFSCIGRIGNGVVLSA